MTLKNAQQFVTKMKENRLFRQKVSDTSTKESLWELVKKEGFDFDERDLAEAMALCMSEMEELAEKMPIT